MKVFAIVALCLCGFVFDWINDFLCWIGLAFWVANIVPVLIIGWIIEVCSARTANRAKGWKWVRAFVFGSIVSVILLTPMPIILRPFLLLIVAIVALPS